MSTEQRYCLNEAEVAAKVMDGEAVIINLSNGMYYGLTGSGAQVWELAAAGWTAGEIAAELRERFDGAEDAGPDVLSLVARLVEEQLLLPFAGERQPAPAPAAPRLRYAAPELEKYTDMGDLMALDPPMPGLHDVPWK